MIYAVTVPVSPGPYWYKNFVSNVLSVFLKYDCPAVAIPVEVWSCTQLPEVLQSNPTVSQLDPVQTKLVTVTAAPAIVSGAVGTNFARI